MTANPIQSGVDAGREGRNDPPDGHTDTMITDGSGSSDDEPFARLTRPWVDLSTTVASPMETFDWAVSCSRAFAAPSNALVIAVRDGTTLRGAAPMIRIGSGLRARLEHAGVTRLYEPTDLMAVDNTAMIRLAHALVDTGMPFILGRLPAHSHAVDAIKLACKGRGVVYQREQATYPYIPLDETWREPEQNVSKRRRSDMRRAWRQAHNLGPISVQMFCPTVSEVDVVVEHAMSVEAKSWKGEQGFDMAADKPIGDFFREYARRAAHSGALRMGFLHIGGDIAAMQIGVVHANRFWVLKVGYDPRYQKASPGILLMMEAIKYAVWHGMETYELLGTSANWTRVWTEHERESVSLRVYPANVRGALAFAHDALRRVIRKVRHSASTS